MKAPRKVTDITDGVTIMVITEGIIMEDLIMVITLLVVMEEAMKKVKAKEDMDMVIAEGAEKTGVSVVKDPNGQKRELS